MSHSGTIFVPHLQGLMSYTTNGWGKTTGTPERFRHLNTVSGQADPLLRTMPLEFSCISIVVQLDLDVGHFEDMWMPYALCLVPWVVPQ